VWPLHRLAGIHADDDGDEMYWMLMLKKQNLLMRTRMFPTFAAPAEDHPAMHTLVDLVAPDVTRLWPPFDKNVQDLSMMQHFDWSSPGLLVLNRLLMAQSIPVVAGCMWMELAQDDEPPHSLEYSDREATV